MCLIRPLGACLVSLRNYLLYNFSFFSIFSNIYISIPFLVCVCNLLVLAGSIFISVVVRGRYPVVSVGSVITSGGARSKCHSVRGHGVVYSVLGLSKSFRCHRYDFEPPVGFGKCFR